MQEKEKKKTESFFGKIALDGFKRGGTRRLRMDQPEGKRIGVPQRG
jgi:hypothetical protein